ncbi:hypothetical protein APR41_13850 [Salegentibacter salinarum]|uniref:Uncharacterized protein n=1 Tax=Salegentibacter salinarum TaxID=447422 RepID=A0A2N0U0D8_9FLAO|nr:hypothetical protein APR41_13850 [Salegentibacter salinarum]
METVLIARIIYKFQNCHFFYNSPKKYKYEYQNWKKMGMTSQILKIQIWENIRISRSPIPNSFQFSKLTSHRIKNQIL